MPRPLALLLCFLAFVTRLAALEPEVLKASSDEPGSFALVCKARGLPLFVDPGSGGAITRAAGDLANDIAGVSGAATTPPVESTSPAGLCILIGRVGAGGSVDRLAREGKIDTSSLKGVWESYLIQVVDNPLPEVPRALVIAGSDLRGTIYGIYDISQSIGVSPWYWWADVPVAQNKNPAIRSGAHFQQSPSVQYRGIFLNDEDWGLQRWAAQTFEPEYGSIGPKTYAKICELLLRLKANTLWPAMHACTKPFNGSPENARVADSYAIIMGSSHAEPMLRNNVREWKDDPKRYDYTINREGVLNYWEQRLVENGRYEAIYTLGMRGIHDSAMQGAKGLEEQKVLLEKIFADQRALLAKQVAADVSKVPQIFCAYKEVLEVYRKGLVVPDDVTLVWPDDNFGFIRNFPSDKERTRSGGSGIYYHISYLGRPLSYLWLCTTPPALIWSEMSKAYDLGARKLWIVNVGDLKPAEIDTEFFLQMGWDIKRWNTETQSRFLESWAAREFGTELAPRIAKVMAEYYKLNAQRKPEHLQWWLPKEPPVPSPLSPSEKTERLAAFQRLVEEVRALNDLLLANQRDAFFQLVAYPVRGSAFANERFFCTEEYQRLKDSTEILAKTYAARALAADRELRNDLALFNHSISNGKWSGIISLEPADKQWSSMRLSELELPKGDFGPIPSSANPEDGLGGAQSPVSSGFAEVDGVISMDARHYSSSANSKTASWECVPGLGRTGHAMAVFPLTIKEPSDSEIVAKAPRLDFSIRFAEADTYTLQFQILPTHPIQAGCAQKLGVTLDEGAPGTLQIPPNDGSSSWAQGVMNGIRTVTTRLKVSSPGRHTLRLFGITPGLVLDKIVLYHGDRPPSEYLGPKETRDTRDTRPAPRSNKKEFESFFQPLRTDKASISPDGESIAYSIREGDSLAVAFASVASPGKTTKEFLVGKDDHARPRGGPSFSGQPARAQIWYLYWISQKRLAVASNTQTNYRYGNIMAVNSDGTDCQTLITGDSYGDNFSAMDQVAGKPNAVILSGRTIALDPKTNKSISECFEFDCFTRKLTKIDSQFVDKNKGSLNEQRAKLRARWGNAIDVLRMMLPAKKVDIIESNENADRILFLAQEVADPGYFGVLDRTQMTATALLRRSHLPPSEDPFTTSVISFKDEKGASHSAILATPALARIKAPPLIVMVPKYSSQQVGLDYDTEVHALTSMGFAVAKIDGAMSGAERKEQAEGGALDQEAESVYQITHYICSHFPVDSKRVALFSMGDASRTTLRALMLHPTRFSCAVFVDAVGDFGDWKEAARKLKDGPTPQCNALLMNFAHSYSGDTPRVLRRCGLKVRTHDLSLPYSIKDPESAADVFFETEKFLNETLYAYDVKVGPVKER